MRRAGESAEEWESKWAVSAVLGGVPERRDPPGHDYDVRVGNCVVALEVTRSAPEERSALNAAIRRRHGRPVDHIATHWQVTIPDAKAGYTGPDLRPIFAKAPPVLRKLEEHGVRGFGPGHERQVADAPDEVRTAIEGLHDLGLMTGVSV